MVTAKKRPLKRPAKTLSPVGPKLPIRGRVSLQMPARDLFVSSYQRIPVRLAPGAPAFDELAFEIPAGPQGGLVSPSRDAKFDPARPYIMLLVGYKPGTYDLVVRNTSTHAVLATYKFSSSTLWPNEDLGPSKWFTGVATPLKAGAAWGGGAAGVQNFNVHPQSGTRRIAVVFVDTNTQRYTTNATDLQAIRDSWVDALINGVTSAGVTRSARAYFREVSNNRFDISALTFGPFNLTGEFGDYFNDDGTPKGNYLQACLDVADSAVNFTNFDTILCVSQQVDANPAAMPPTPRRGAWPWATIGEWGPYTTADGTKNIAFISMPNDWEIADGRRLYETFSHELGHNLGLGDQYTPSVSGRNLGSWELMDSESGIPHMSCCHKLILGWFDTTQVVPFNFQSMAAPVDQTVTLSPIEVEPPAAGRRRAIEIRIADGWNYYFEYRRGQAPQIGDRSLPTDSRVLGSDVVSAPFSPPFQRPGLLLLDNDIDGDGAVLGNGQDYEEVDTSDPVYPTDFRVDVSGIDGTKADVWVRYGVNSRPDPSIRPWPASADRQWQSPDIEVKNAKNLADPAWFNVPWSGNENTIVASIKNNGALDAPSVRANFYVKDFTVSGAPESFIGFDTKNVPAGATVTFECNRKWFPPAEAHYCVVVRIPLYQLPTNLSVVEMTELNNIAQTNYDRFISATASPPSREMTSVTVANPFHERTRFFIVAGQTNPTYRTYVEHAWLYLDPGETRSVGVMFEFAPDNLSNGVFANTQLGKVREMMRVPNDVALASFAEDPRDKPRHAIWKLGGVDVQVVTGKATKFQRFGVDSRSAVGTIVTVDASSPVRGGNVVLRASRSGKPETFDYQSAPVSTTGTFNTKLGIAGTEVTAFYVPSSGYGECTSDSRPMQ
jgi:M6 family metalloprotease-like protein